MSARGRSKQTSVLGRYLAECERKYVMQKLYEAGGCVSQLARNLGVSRGHVYRILKPYNQASGLLSANRIEPVLIYPPPPFTSIYDRAGNQLRQRRTIKKSVIQKVMDLQRERAAAQ